jgi:hypothetical protein
MNWTKSSRIAVLGGVACVVLLSAGRTAFAQVANPDMLLDEIRKLRAEILQYQMDSEAVRIAILEDSLSQIQLRRSQLLRREVALTQELVNLQRELASSNLTPAERTQLESMKNASVAEETERLRAEDTSLKLTESRISGSLRTQQQHLENLQTKVRELTGNRMKGT